MLDNSTTLELNQYIKPIFKDTASRIEWLKTVTFYKEKPRNKENSNIVFEI